MAILLSRVVYRLIEMFMWFVALFTLVGLIWASANAEVIRSVPDFMSGLVIPEWPRSRPWDRADATKLLTAVTFAGLGGFWTLFYSYWLRDKGCAMAFYMGRVTGPITGRPESMPDAGALPGRDEGLAHWPAWRRFLLCDVSIGVVGNILTTLLTCLLAYALLYPQNLLPQNYDIAVVQSRFFEASWGWWGKVLFLIIAAAFLSDTWLATVDAVSRIHTDCVYGFFPRARNLAYRKWYLFFLLLLTAITSVTIQLDEPGTLILISAVIGFVGTVTYSIALVALNYFYLPHLLPAVARPGKTGLSFLLISCAAYLALAVLYILTVTGVI
jgi:hypothetical protein